MQNHSLSDFNIGTLLKIKFSDNSEENIQSIMYVNCGNLSGGTTLNGIYQQYSFYKSTESVTIKSINLTFLSIAYLNTNDYSRNLHFDSNDSKYGFSFGYFSGDGLPKSSDIKINNGNLVMKNGNTEKIFFRMSSDI